MRISVVIPTLNEALCVRKAIVSCWESGFEEVVVADGGSTDGTQRIAAEFGALVVQGTRGRAAQLNLGAQHAAGEVLLFLHADNWLSAAAGQQIRSSLEEETISAGAFRQHIEARGYLYRLLECGNAARVGWSGLAYGDQAIFMRRDVFGKLGGYPDVSLMEDLLLMRKFRKLGRVALLPGPVYVSPRRWQRKGVLLQTLRNWSLVTAERLGVSPNRLARFYPAHSDQSADHLPSVTLEERLATPIDP
ncbi:MAG: TIGR04283 family arsenosugar biosynthesis glycosyltransferase [Planctomycetota bacterium]